MMKQLLFMFSLVLLAFRLHAQTPDSELQLARQYSAAGDFEKALAILQRLYRQQDETYFSDYAACLLSLRKLDEAEDAARKMIRRHPGDPSYGIILGRIYTEKKEQDHATKLYAALIKKLPPEPSAIARLANAFYENGDIDEAIRTLQTGRHLLNDDKLYAFELLNLYRLKHDKSALIGEYLNVLHDNPLYLTQVEAGFSAELQAPEDYELLKEQIYRHLQKQPGDEALSRLLGWLFLQQRQYEPALDQAIALSRLLNDQGRIVFDLCRTMVENKAYQTALRGYTYIMGLGTQQSYYIAARVELLLAKDMLVSDGKYTQAGLLALDREYSALLSEFGKSAATVFAMQRQAHLEAFKLHRAHDAVNLLEQAVRLPGLQPAVLASSKLDLGDTYLLDNRPWDAALLYRQVETDDPGSAEAQEARFRDAKLAYYKGDFAWAKSQLDVLKAATSQLIANDALNLSLLLSDHLSADSSGKALQMYARAELLIFAEEPSRALAVLDSIDLCYPGNQMDNDIRMAKAKIYIADRHFAEAVGPLKEIVEKHPSNLWADDAVFMLGDLFENKLGNKELARQYYQKIISDYPGSLWVNEARKRFRLLRGDKTESAS